MALHLLIALNFLTFMVIAGARLLYSLYALDLGASPTQIGAMIAVLYVFPLLSWPIGVLCDRFGGRWLLVAGLAAGGVGMLAPLFWRELWTLYVALATLGVTMGF